MAKTKTTARPKTARKSAKTASRKTKSSTKSRAAEPRNAGDEEVTIDRRRPTKFRTDEKAGNNSPLAETGLERRQKVNRRRQIDPTTCERDYTDDEVEFMNAIDHYKRTERPDVPDVQRSAGSCAVVGLRAPLAERDGGRVCERYAGVDGSHRRDSETAVVGDWQ